MKIYVTRDYSKQEKGGGPISVVINKIIDNMGKDITNNYMQEINKSTGLEWCDDKDELENQIKKALGLSGSIEMIEE